MHTFTKEAEAAQQCFSSHAYNGKLKSDLLFRHCLTEITFCCREIVKRGNSSE